MNTAKSVFAWMAALLALPAAAEDLQPLESIRQTAEAFVEAQYQGDDVEAEAGRLDPRLRLNRCDRSLEAFATAATAAGGNRSVGVRCTGTRPWTLYVPVRVRRYETVVMLARTIQRGAVLSRNDLRTVERDVTALNSGYFSKPEALAGHRLRRSAAAGTVLTPALVHRPPAIARGDRITLVSNGGGVSVSAPGEALADARRGERLSVRNLSSGKVVEGVVRDQGVVEVLGR